MVALKRVFLYLNSMKDWRLRFGGALRGALRERALRGDGDGALGCYIDSDYAGWPDDYQSTSGLVMTFGGAFDWRSRKEQSTAHSTTDAEGYTCRVGCMRCTQIPHLHTELGIQTIPHMLSDSQSLIARNRNRIDRTNGDAHIATKYYLAADMARDGELDMSKHPTAVMLADCFRKPLPKRAFVKRCTAMGMIGNGLGNGLGNGSGNGRGNGIAIGIKNGLGH